MPFLTALHVILAATAPGLLRDRLDSIAHAINHGSTIAAAFAQHPRLFNPVFIAVLSAGETSGDLATTFAQLTKQLRWQDHLQQQLGRALRYPLFLLCLALGVITFMMTMVVPQVIAFLNSISSELPFLTRLLIRASELFMASWWMILLVLIAGLSIFLIACRHSERLALRMDRCLLALPGLGQALQKVALARFAHSLAILLQSGISLPSSLHSATAVLGHRALVAEALFAGQQLQAGHPLSVATMNLFPPLVTQRLRVGEQSGRLAKTLDNITHFYDNEVQTTVERFIASLEPALTIAVGVLLAWVVLAVLGPVYSSLGQLSQTP